jgi:hypothetical protein
MEWQGNTLFQGVDGGVYKTSNGGSTWTDVSGDLVISQMYRLGVSKADTRVITGLQDNGTKLRNTAGVWTDNIGGDEWNAPLIRSHQPLCMENTNMDSYRDLPMVVHPGLKSNLPYWEWILDYTICNRSSYTYYIICRV